MYAKQDKAGGICTDRGVQCIKLSSSSSVVAEYNCQHKLIGDAAMGAKNAAAVVCFCHCIALQLHADTARCGIQFAGNKDDFWSF